MSSKLAVIDKLFSPNVFGVSRWVSTEECIRAGLPWSTNGNTRNKIVWNDNRYTWKFIRGKYRKITTLKMDGFSEMSMELNRPISADIRKAFKNNACVVCGTRSDIVIDHKNDLYNDPRVLDVNTQVIDDFQTLCNHCNLQKRSVSVNTRKTGKRYPATNIPSMAVFGVDFILGDENYDLSDIDAMVGTFWHDPVKFTKNIQLLKDVREADSFRVQAVFTDQDEERR